MRHLSFSRNVVLMSLITLCLSLGVKAFAGVHAYPELEPKIASDVVDILIKHGMPVRHDREDKWFYIAGGYTRWVGGSPSYTLYFYQADEIPLPAKVEIIDYCMKLYEAHAHRLEIRIEMRHEEFKPKFFLPSTYFEMVMKSNQP